jgi:hypothetical protein
MRQLQIEGCGAMARSIGFVTALGAGAILLLLALAVPQAFAVEDTDRCGGPCGDYELLVKAIAAHVSGEKTVDW